jgi:4-methylaminobutanoate oxidase (formaldehyde-forming)
MGWERPSFFVPGGESVDTTPTFARPDFYDRVAAEHAAARSSVALFDQTSYGKLRVRGKDAEALLQRLCANDLGVPPGKVVYTGMLNARGGYESDCTVFRLADDEYLIVTGTAQPVRDLDWIRRNRQDEAVRLDDVTAGTAVLALAGPKARDLLAAVSGDDFSNEAFPYMAWRDVEIGVWPVRAARLSYVGELGWELYMPTEFAAGVYDLLFEAGFGLRDAGTIAMTGLRLEKGYRAWGHDLTPETTPLEAGLGFAAKIDSDKPFIGQEALRRQRDDGLGKRLVTFILDDPDVLAIGGEPIVWNGKFVGQVSSAAYGHTVGRSVALGPVTAADDAVEDMVNAGGFEIEMAAKRFAATASFRAPYDPEGGRLRG